MTEAFFDGVTYLRCENCGEFVVEGEAEAHQRGCDVRTGPATPEETQAEMTLNQLIATAAGAYPEAYLLQYWDTEASEPKDNPVGGDTLAQFVAHELADTYDEAASDAEKIETAARKIREAARDLDAVANALAGLQQESAA